MYDQLYCIFPQSGNRWKAAPGSVWNRVSRRLEAAPETITAKKKLVSKTDVPVLNLSVAVPTYTGQYSPPLKYYKYSIINSTKDGHLEGC